MIRSQRLTLPSHLLAQLLVISLLGSGLLLAADANDPHPANEGRTEQKLFLRDHWNLQSSAKFEGKGEVVSTSGFVPKGWHEATVPTTVVAAMVKDKTLPDPFFAVNLRKFAGVTYPIGGNFSNIAMQPDSPYAVSWWYRKQFAVPASYAGKTVWLNFRGINYRANVWLNGKQIASSDEIAGAWRTYELNVSKAVKPGGENVLAVQVFAPTENDLAITFVDWNPAPPDKNMGLWREVYLTTSGPVALRYPTVVSKLNLPTNDSARLTVTARLKNGTSHTVQGKLKGQVENVTFEQDVELGSNESKDITFTPEQYPQLVFTNPRLWWPAQMGKPNLYPLTMQFEIGSSISDRSHTEFGIREITSELNSTGGRAFHVNGKNILIRGGGWTPDMMMRENSQRLHDEFRYVRDMGLNTVRLEGKLETQEFFDLADHDGILVMAGWCCCDFWERWARWKPQDFEIAKQSLRDQIYRLRSHPSLVMWLNGSDNPPPPDVEQMYLGVEKELLWPNPVVSSATGKATSVTGNSGVKMTGPYEYVAPEYWEQDTLQGQPTRKACNPGGCGGAYGFNTETSMGPAVPPIESIRAMVGKEHLWPIDDVWNYHDGGGEFKTIKVFTDALTNRYGPSNNAEDFAFKSQLQTYEGVRAMYEAYSRNKYQATGVIQWMLNNAWPSMIWHLYDYYLRPGGGYFGAKRAMEALHPVYGYDDHSVWVVSSQYEDAKGLKLTTKIYDLDMAEKFSHEDSVDAAADGTAKILTLPDVPGLSSVYFLALRLTDSSGKLVGSNFYWLSTKPETLDWAKSNWWMTPTDSFADYTALAKLPKVKLKFSERTERKGEESITHVTIENPSKSLAFFVRLKINKDAAGEEILPVVWQDNYISLLPGERREVTATYRSGPLGTEKPVVKINGWNVE
ncbi:MAG TPA: beta galactosidase jelly roll domain-containing protein [Candidatus Aquilonibacter sp.]|jgi:exo-1,4-beta-D-glucosaminidase|nr:beta galactosidase jelly roll domain-containing protein [Candidatus Aquilonibacter sp.]